MAHGTIISNKQMTPLEPGAWELTGLSVEVMEPVVAEADARFEEARNAILPSMKAA
jgi:hypothetical protein